MKVCIEYFDTYEAKYPMELLRNVVKSLKQNVPLKYQKIFRGARVFVNLYLEKKERISRVNNIFQGCD